MPKTVSLVLFGCQCVAGLLVLATLMQFVVFLPGTNGNELSFSCLTNTANSPNSEQIYIMIQNDLITSSADFVNSKIVDKIKTLQCSQYIVTLVL